MKRQLNGASLGSELCGDDVFDLDGLLHPAQAFEHPSNVVNDPDLTLNEKRAILASWASDACAIEAAPAFRQVPGGKCAVTFDEVIEALRTLDNALAGKGWQTLSAHPAVARPSRDGPNNTTSGGGEQGPSLN